MFYGPISIANILCHLCDFHVSVFCLFCKLCEQILHILLILANTTFIIKFYYKRL